jgi:hypothetical protein
MPGISRQPACSSVAFALIATAADRRALRGTARELGSLDVEDREWLGAIPARLLEGAPEPPAARFNAGQKVNFILVSILLAALFVTGVDTIVSGTYHNLIFGGHELATIALCVGRGSSVMSSSTVRHATRCAGF